MSNAETLGQTANNGCACRCGLPVNNAESTFLPGHDARLVSKLVGWTVAGSTGATVRGYEMGDNSDQQAIIDTIASQVNRNHGGPLAAKYDNAAHNAWTRYDARTDRAAAKAKAKADRAAAKQLAEDDAAAQSQSQRPPAGEGQITPKWLGNVQDRYTDGTKVKVGRWTYDAVKSAEAGDKVIGYLNRQGDLVSVDGSSYSVIN